MIEESPTINAIGDNLHNRLKKVADKTFNKWGPDVEE